MYFLLDLVEDLDLSEILIPPQAKDPRGEKGYDTGLTENQVTPFLLG